MSVTKKLMLGVAACGLAAVTFLSVSVASAPGADCTKACPKAEACPRKGDCPPCPLCPGGCPRR